MLLITGGAGFIGSALVSRLNNIGHDDIIIVDRLRNTSKWKNLRNLKYQKYIHADEFFLPENKHILKQISSIFHMGACSSTTEMDMDYLIKNNVIYSQQIFNLSQELDIPFIYASSAATYGNGEFSYNDNHQNIYKLRPLNPYGYSKQIFDEWMLKQRTSQNKWFGLKFFNVFGPNEYHKDEMRSLIHKSFFQINETGQVRLFKSYRNEYKDGGQLRDFIYVKDLVLTMIKLLDVDRKNSGIYNLGTGLARSFYDLASITFKVMNKKENILFIDMPKNLKEQYQYYTQANMQRLTNIIPDLKFRTLENSIDDYINNFLSQKDPYFDGKITKWN